MGGPARVVIDGTAEGLSAGLDGLFAEIEQLVAELEQRYSRYLWLLCSILAAQM